MTLEEANLPSRGAIGRPWALVGRSLGCQRSVLRAERRAEGSGRESGGNLCTFQWPPSGKPFECVHAPSLSGRSLSLAAADCPRQTICGGLSAGGLSAGRQFLFGRQQCPLGALKEQHRNKKRATN